MSHVRRHAHAAHAAHAAAHAAHAAAHAHVRRALAVFRVSVFVYRWAASLVALALRLLPGRVLWTRALRPDAAPRWTPWRVLLGGAPAPALLEGKGGGAPVAVVAWYRGALVRTVVSAPVAAELGVMRQRLALACLFGGPALEHAARRARRVLGVAHNYFDVTAEARPWFAAIADCQLTAVALACLLGRTAGARRHVADVLWDTLDETHLA